MYLTTLETVTVSGCADPDDLNGPASVWYLCNIPSNGGFSIGTDLPCITYTPNLGFVGTDELCLVICDETNVCDTTLFIITSLPVILTTDTLYLSTDENTSVGGCVDVNELVTPPVGVSICATPANGELFTFANGDLTCFTYVPASGFIGIDTMCLLLCDANGFCDTTIIVVTVVDTVIVIPPVTDTIYVQTTENTSVTACVDTDELTGFVNSFSVCGLPANGELFLDPIGLCAQYVPDPGFIGNDTMCVVVCDENNVCDTTILIATVEPVVIDDNEIDTVYVTTSEAIPVTACLVNDDLEGPPVSFNIFCFPALGGFTFNDTTYCVTYTPNFGVLEGTDQICFSACDDMGNCDTTIVIITIEPYIYIPLNVDTVYATTFEATAVTACAVIDDLTGTPVSVSLCGLPTNGGFSIDTATLCVTYTPNINFEEGQDEMCLYVCDDLGNCDTTVFIFTVMPYPTTVDTLYVETESNTSVVICIPNEEIPGDVVSIAPCEDPSLGMLVLNGADTCITYVPLPDTIGQDTFCIVMCNSIGVCDTTIVIVTIVSDTCATPVGNVLLQAPSCEETASLCIDIPFTEIGNYSITDFDQPYNGPLVGCDFDSVYVYMYAILPNQGAVGPYQVDIWTFDGNAFSGPFDSIPALVDSMNIWDPDGNWALDPVSLTISGGSSSNAYSSLIISQMNTGIISELEVNLLLTPLGTSLTLDTGTHFIEILPIDDDCPVIILDVLVNCGAQPVVSTDTVYLFTYVDSMLTYCIDTSELLGDFISVENICEPNSVDFVNFIVGDSICITIIADAIGTDTACIVVCDAFGICDTTIIVVTVLPDSVQLEPPVAVDDDTTTVINTPVIIDVVANDTINGSLTVLVILDEPLYGSAFVNSDQNVEYVPSPETCDVVDSFTYIIGNSIGFDTATVTVEILCDSLTIYSGFSPNGDGVNDTFTILGLSNFPDNELMVFNRWGNRVFEATNYQNNWDGKWEGKDLPDGTYFYVLDLGTGEKLSGYVQIHR